MRVVPLNSSVLSGLAWDGERLYAQFSNGTVYKYEGVEADTVLSILFDPDSQGKAFDAKIKKGSYPYQKVDDPEGLGFHV